MKTKLKTKKMKKTKSKLPQCDGMQPKCGAKESLIYALIVAAITFIAFHIRTIPANTVFLPDGSVRFGTNDAWYHMRTLSLYLKHFPERIFFNPMTNYPYGSYIHFGPLFDQMIAAVALILGLGNPSPELVNIVGAYFPAVLGALTVIPCYYIGKCLGGRKTGIIAAILIAVAPGQFLSRSLIGFTDHHVAEALFSTLFMLFFMLAVVSGKQVGLGFKDISSKNFKKLRKPMLYAVLAGLMYSAYLLIWVGAPLFAFIVLVYAILQYTLNNLHKESSDYLTIVGVLAFLVSALTVLPAIHSDMGFSIFYYSWFTVATALGAAFSFIALSGLEKLVVKKKLKPYFYPLLIFGLGVLGLFSLHVAIPSLYNNVMAAPDQVFGVKTGGASTIAEAASIFYMNGTFTFANAYGNFTAFGFLTSILGILILGANIIYKPKTEKVFLFVWSLLIFCAIYGQNRFAYYYSVNVALLCAYAGGLLLEKVKWDNLDTEIKDNVQSVKDIPKIIQFVKAEQVLVVCLIVGAFVYPAYAATAPYTYGSIDPSNSWMEACTWLNISTPDPGMDYNTIYQPPENGRLFEYPDKAYGVMSWWDYGHYIEVIGHRMPNANPFQAGVGGRRNSINETNQPGAASYFTAQSEGEANKILDAIDPRPGKMGARYIMSDAKMATTIFMAMAAWTLDTEGYMKPYWMVTGYQNLPSERYYNSMEARLHIFDGNGLEHYRMVHETEIESSPEAGYKKIYNFLYEGNIPEVETGNVKIFEYVKGARITGLTIANNTVSISTTIRTSQNRTFTYSQTTKAGANGNYSFTVPYSTNGSIPGGTQFDVMPITPYIVNNFGMTEPVYVNETDVLSGREIRV